MLVKPHVLTYNTVSTSIKATASQREREKRKIIETMTQLAQCASVKTIASLVVDFFVFVFVYAVEIFTLYSKKTHQYMHSLLFSAKTEQNANVHNVHAYYWLWWNAKVNDTLSI